MTVAYPTVTVKILWNWWAISYTGESILQTKYINQIERFGHWKDSGIRIDGPATELYQTISHELVHQPRWNQWLWSISFGNQTRHGSGLCILYVGPSSIYKTKVGKIVYQNLINQAEDFVYITTPYLIITIMIWREDIKYGYPRRRCSESRPIYRIKNSFNLAAQGAYPDLLSAGVRIFELHLALS